MDLSRALVSSILHLPPSEGKEALAQAIARGISENRLHGDGRDAFIFVRDYFQKHGALPNVHQLSGKTGISLTDTDFFTMDDVPERSAPWFIDEVNNLHLHVKIQEGLKQVIEFQEKRQPLMAYNQLEKLLVDLRSEQIGLSAVESLFKLGPEIRAFYERLKNGEMGLPLPWDKLNELTLGLWPEDLVLFVARAGVGKTWTAILLALHAWRTPQKKTGKQNRVLFITTEVSKMRIGMRFFAAMERLPYGEFTHGRLDNITQEPRFYKAVEDLYNAEGLYIIGGDFDFQIESVASAIETCKPDLVILDGVYLLRVQGATRNERMANAFDEMKRLAKRKKVPLIITTQFNREVKKDIAKTVQMESIALSDVGAWNADLIFGLLQSDDYRNENKMAFKPLKVREGALDTEVLVNWNFERMDFSEMVTSGGAGGDADEFGVPKLPSDPQTPSADDDMPF